MHKRSQSAMEFLMSYGWALLVVLIVIGALAFFGILNPDRFLPEKAEAGPSITIIDSTVDENGVTLLIKNSAGKTLTNVQVNVTDCGAESQLSTPVNLAQGESKTVTVYCNHGLSENSVLKSDLKVSYTTKTDATSLSHVTSGRVVKRVNSGNTYENWTSISACGDLSLSNSVYFLSQSITINDASCFNITANNVTLDMNGFTLQGNDGGVDIGIHVSGYNGSTIRGGTVLDFYRCIKFENNNNNTISNVTISSCNVYGIETIASSYNTFIDLNVSYGPGPGMYIDGDSNHSEFSGLTVSNNGYNGLYIASGSFNTLDDINASNNQQGGISISGRNNSLTDIITNENEWGLSILGVNHTFENITANTNDYDGIWLIGSDENIFRDITANSNLNYGIYFSSYTASDNQFFNTQACSNTITDINCSNGSGNSGTNMTFDSSVTCSGWPVADNSCS